MATAIDLIKAVSSGHVSLAGARDKNEFLAMLDDRIWEVVGGGPLGWRHRSAMPAQAMTPADAGRFALTAMATGIIVVGGRDEGAMKAFLEDLDDWCGTGWPRRWPRPKLGPHPDPWKEFDPSVLLGGALEAAELAARYPGGELQEFFGVAAERLTEAALGAR